MEQINSRSYTGFEGLKLSADVGGPANAPPVILLHGGGQTRHSWGGAMRELIRRGYHVISLDARGHGQSQWSDSGNYSLESFSGDLLAVIRSLSAPPVIVGASMGGATGLYLLGNQPPELAAGLVLVDVVPRMERKGAEKIGRFMRGNPDGFANLEEAAEAVAAYNPHRPRPKDPEGLKKNLRQRNGRWYWHWDPKFTEPPESAEPPDFTAPLLQACAGIKVPTLLVRGTQSDIVGERGTQELQQLIPSAQVFDVEGAGHMVAGDRNDAFNAGVIGFLEQLPSHAHPASS